MIDLHCHVLWGVDDGPKSLEESVESCRALKEKGIQSIIATPHYISGSSYMAPSKAVLQKADELKNVLDNENVGLNIHTGMELFLTPELPDLLKSGEVLSLNGTKYVLVETSLGNVPEYIEDVFFKLQLDGYIPVMAHPERYTGNMDMKKIERYVSKGVLMQVNTGSIMGKYGKDARVIANRLLTAGLVQFIATDTHSYPERFTSVEGIKGLLIKFIGTENTEKLLHTNPEKLLKNENIEYLEPAPVKRSFFKKIIPSF